MILSCNYSVEIADIYNDRNIIINIWKRNLTAHGPEEHEIRFDWHYHHCPFGPGRVWLLRSLRDGSIIGTAGLGLRRIRMGDATILSGIAVDFAVDREHRLLLPALMLQRAVIRGLEEDLDLVYGLPNRTAIKIFGRVGYQMLGTLSRYVKVLRVERFLNSRKMVPKFARPLVGAIADTGMRLRSPETWRQVKGRVLKELQEFDGRFDDLWEQVSTGAEMIGVRTSDFLRWRYKDCPLQDYVTLGLLSLGEDRLFGYVIFYAGDDEQVRIADLLTDGSESAVENLLAGVIRWSRRTGAASVAFELFGAPWLEGVLRRFRFVKREMDAQLSVFPRVEAPTELMSDRLKDWYFLRGDENVNTL